MRLLRNRVSARVLWPAIWMCLTGCAVAETVSDRLSVLVQSVLLTQMEGAGVWEISVEGGDVIYACAACSGRVTARLQVVALPRGMGVAEGLADLKRLRAHDCASWAVDGVGRCLETRPVRMAPGGLVGLEMSQDLGGVWSMDTTVFYRGGAHGPEMIRSVLFVRGQSDVPAGTVEMLRAHMKRLTLFW